MLKGSPVRREQSLGLFRGHFQASAIQPTFCPPRLSSILNSRILTSSAAHTSASSAKPMIVVPAGRSKRRKSSYMTLQTGGGTRDPWGAQHVIPLWETICRPYISPTCRLDSHLSAATGSLEPSSVPSPRCRYSISRYWAHCVCQCWSTLISSSFFPSYPINILIYRMGHPPEACCPSSAGPTSTSSSRRRTSLPEDRNWRLLEGSPIMPRSPLWGSRLAPCRSPALCLP